MGRIIREYKRRKRTRKKTILIGVEGKKNRTENLYFNGFNVRGGNYIIKLANGNSTDPVKMVNDIIKTMKLKDINSKYGDMIYCVFDGDMDDNKNVQIIKAISLASKYNIEIIVSNPCFEEWFLCHFVYTTKSLSSSEVINKLKTYIPDYEKNLDVFQAINNLTNIGVKNAKKQVKYHESLGRNINLVQSNPCSTVYKIVLKIKNEMFQ